VPAVDQNIVTRRWQEFRRAYAEWAVPRGQVREVTHVQPVIRLVLEAAAGGTPKFKLWHGRTAADDVDAKGMAPDFSFTRLLEATLSVVAVLFLLEVKLAGKLQDAYMQAMCYGRRRVQQLVKDALERGDAADGVVVLVGGTDGHNLIICKICSGAPAAGSSFEGCLPCPSEFSTELSLLPSSWTWNSRSVPPQNPTCGFASLVRILSAEADDLPGGSLEAPLRFLDTVDQAGNRKRWVLGARLGSGGMSDVYEVNNSFPSTLVAKLPRAATATTVAAYDAEEASLSALARAHVSCVAVLVGRATRVREEVFPRSPIACPVLLLTPRGKPLSSVVREHLAPARRLTQFANTVVAQLLATCTAMYDASVVHCDIRPDNVVIDERDRVVLVDFSSARRDGEKFEQDYRAFGLDSQVATAATDVVAAALLWIAIVHGGGGGKCRAPWHGGHVARVSWMAAHRALPGVSDVEAYVGSVVLHRRRNWPVWHDPA
jgi:hypothetical protein